MATKSSTFAPLKRAFCGLLYFLFETEESSAKSKVFDAKKFDTKYAHDSSTGDDQSQTNSASIFSKPRPPTPRWKYMFGLDIRSVALWRVAVGLIVIGDLIDRGRFMKDHYTDYGLMPRYSVLENYWNEYYICLHLATGSLLGQYIIFSINALFGFFLAIGFYSRFSAFMCWLFAYSIQVREPFLLHGGDQYLRLLLFFTIFMPIGECCSVDNALWYSLNPRKASRCYITQHVANLLGLTKKESGESDSSEVDKVESEAYESYPSTKRSYGETLPLLSNVVINAGTLAVPIQIMTMYIASVYHKNGPQWHEEGTSVYYALQLDYFRMPLGDFFLYLIGDSPQYNWKLWWMTYIVMQWEFWGNFLFVSPFFTQKARLLATVGFMFMHLNFGMCLRLGTFMYITFCAPLCLLPSMVWDDIIFGASPTLQSKAAQFNDLKQRVTKLDDNNVSSKPSRLCPLRSYLPLCFLARPDRVFTIVYDDSYNYLSILIRCVATLFLVPAYRLIPKSQIVEDKENTPRSPLVLITKEREFEDFEAFVEICRRSPILFVFGWFLDQSREWPPAHSLYKWTFSLFSRSVVQPDEGVVPGKGIRGLRNRRRLSIKKVRRVVVTLVVLSLVCLVISWNMANFGKANVQKVNWVGWLLGLDQAWGMFSPHPPLSDWYHVIETTLEGDIVGDLIPDEGLFKWKISPLTWEKPVPIYWSYMKSHRWQKVWENFNENHEWYRLQVGKWICRNYNSRHRGIAFGEPQIKEFKIWVIYNEQRLDGTRGPQERYNLWHHIC